MNLAPIWYYFIVGNVFDFLYPSFFLPLHYVCCCNESYYRGWLSNHKTNHETKPGRKLMACTPKDPTYFCYLVRPFYFPYHRAAQPIPLAVSMRQCKEKARHETKCLHPKSVNKRNSLLSSSTPRASVIRWTGDCICMKLTYMAPTLIILQITIIRNCTELTIKPSLDRRAAAGD